MALFSSLAVMTVTRLGFKLAEKKKWLPSGVYHQLAMQKLRAGLLQEAVKLNDIALQKRPDSEKALIVKDLLAMRRDALLRALLTHINSTQRDIRTIEKKQLVLSRRLKRINVVQRLHQIVPWLFFVVNVFIYFLSYFYLIVWQKPMLGSLLGGSAVLCSVLVYFLIQSIRDCDIQNSLKKAELLSTQRSMQREMDIQKKRLRTLQSKLSETRYQLMVK